jgi:hypothetical protein
VAQDWGPGTAAEAAAEWRDSVRAAAADGPRLGERYRRVRYEDLLADPRAEVAALLEWLALAPGALDAILAEGATEFNVGPPGSLSDADVAAVEEVAGDELEANGYELLRPRVALRSIRRRRRRSDSSRELVTEFERRVAAGGDARKLLAPEALPSVDWAALGHHAGAEILGWKVHAGTDAATTSMRYRHADGSEWMRVAVYRVADGRIAELTLYRDPIAT